MGEVFGILPFLSTVSEEDTILELGVNKRPATDLTGTLYPVLDVKEKIQSAKDAGLEMVIFCPDVYEQCAVHDFESLPLDLRDYARTALRPAKTMVEVMELTIPGKDMVLL